MEKKNLNQSFGTLSETINGLIRLGYTHDFNVKDDFIVCNRTNITLSPDDFQIDHVYRFEGDSDPEYQSILYAISSTKFDVKGILVNGYGISSDEAATRLIEKLNTHHEQYTIKNKLNESILHRPEGDRIINAPLIEIKLNAYISEIKAETNWTDNDRNSVTLFKSDSMRIVLIGLHEKAELKPHIVNGLLSVQVLQGKVEFKAEKQNTHLETGQMVALHENITHSVRALTESFLLLTLVMNSK